MKIEQAIRQVSQTVFKPGWEVRARASVLGYLLVEFHIDTVDTSYPDADGVCRRPIRLLRDRMLDVTGMNELDLCYALVRLASETDSHENREFLKIRRPDGTWRTPLHPHTTEGIKTWNRLEKAGSR